MQTARPRYRDGIGSVLTGIHTRIRTGIRTGTRTGIRTGIRAGIRAGILTAMTWATSASAATYTVTPDGTGDFPTIADAVSAAVSGDIIELTDGTFTGLGNNDVLISGLALTIRSQSGDPGTTTIDCEASAASRHRAFLLESAQLHLEDLRIKNGFAPDLAEESSGGAIRSVDSILEIDGCLFTSNEARHLQLSSGGAIFAGGGELRVNDSSFFQNESGGPGQAIRAVSLTAPLELEGCNFEQSTFGFSLVRVDSSSVALVDCGFFDSSNRGVTVYSADSVRVADCEFRDNGDYGLLVQECGSFEMEDCLFHRVQPTLFDFTQGAQIADATGHIERTDIRGLIGQNSSGLVLASSTMTVRDCLIDGNTGRSTGGILAYNGSTVVEGCTITRNFGSLGGGAFSSNGTNTFVVRNSVVWGNCSAADRNDVTQGTNVSFECSVVDPDEVPDSVTFIDPPIVTDPLFCNPATCDSASVEIGDYTVSASSPCLPANNDCGVQIGARGQNCGALGACCLTDGSCVVATPESCSASSGTYLGDGSSCIGTPCQSLGACCDVDGTCTIVSEEICLQASGLFLGEESICDVPCNGNNGGVLVLHTDPGIEYTPGMMSYCGAPLPPTCGEVNARIDVLETQIASVLALFDSEASASIIGLSFGVDYDTEDVRVVDVGSCGDFQFPTASWPSPGSGTQIFWNSGQSGPAIEVAWLAPYSYRGQSSSLSLTPHPEQGAFFQDDNVPSVAVPIADLGSLGFFTDGTVPCPASPAGACCLADASCQMQTAADCRELGTFFGAGSVCEPDPCDPADVALGPDGHEALRLRVRGPNPGRGPVTLDLYVSGDAETVTVEWLDAAGRRLGSSSSIQADHGWSRHEIDPRRHLASVPAGIYFLRAESGSGVATARVVRIQ